MTRKYDERLDGLVLEGLLVQAQNLLTAFERVPAPPLGSLQELQLRLARAHAHGLVDQLAEIVSSNGAPREELSRSPISETVTHETLRSPVPRA